MICLHFGVDRKIYLQQQRELEVAKTLIAEFLARINEMECEMRLILDNRQAVVEHRDRLIRQLEQLAGATARRGGGGT